MKTNRSLNDERAHTDFTEDEYHSVAIRHDLPTIPKHYHEEPLHCTFPKEFWMEKLNPAYAPERTAKYRVQYSITNGPYTSICARHPILTAWLRAYNSHEDIILSPDDIWLMICIYFANYVNTNSAKFQHLYTNGLHKRSITIEDDRTVDSDWVHFLERMHSEMTRVIDSDICSLLKNDFSTTSNMESLLSCLTVMSTFKKCSDSSHSINACGIRYVHFMGGVHDWILLRDKADRLRSFNRDNDAFFEYLTGVLPILDQFIQTYQGQVDNQFWDTIFDLHHTKDESSQSNGLSMSGWFLRLCYGNHTQARCLMASVELNSLIVPVHVDNEHADTSKTCYLVGGFHGVRSHNEKHRPVLSLAIVDDLTTVKELDS